MRENFNCFFLYMMRSFIFHNKLLNNFNIITININKNCTLKELHLDVKFSSRQKSSHYATYLKKT